jgi:hypothetical protein
MLLLSSTAAISAFNVIETRFLGTVETLALAPQILFRLALYCWRFQLRDIIQCDLSSRSLRPEKP